MGHPKGPKLLDGKPIRAAEKGISLAIRTSDIRHAVATAPDACAAAIACVRQLGALSARVHPSRTYIEYDKEWVRYTTSPSLREEIVAIDTGGKFHPGIYLLGGSKTSRDGKKHSPVPNGKYDRTRAKKRSKPKYVHTVRGHIHFGAEPLPPEAIAGVLAERSSK